MDDAGIIRLSSELALVQTVDFFTPIVDDPGDFGFIAAMNALSDIYAMGGEPLSALAVCGFPRDVLPLSVLREIFQGAAKALEQEGVALLGGHTVKAPELTYGLAVTGTVHPQRFLSKGGAKPGDWLLLTKALGTGVLSTWEKAGALPPVYAPSLLASMKASNGQASRVLRSLAHALTDVTGFGFLGHALEMAQASQVSLEIFADQVPFLPGAREAVEAKAIPGGLKANRRWVEGRVRGWEKIPETVAVLLCDPQTSGGLLAAVPPEALATVKDQLPSAALVGRVLPGPEIFLSLSPQGPF
jgi:selenide,water dikinase